MSKNELNLHFNMLSSWVKPLVAYHDSFILATAKRAIFEALAFFVEAIVVPDLLWSTPDQKSSLKLVG